VDKVGAGPESLRTGLGISELRTEKARDKKASGRDLQENMRARGQER